VAPHPCSVPARARIRPRVQAQRATKLRQLWPQYRPTTAPATREIAGRRREGRDSNPGAPCGTYGFQDRLRPSRYQGRRANTGCDLEVLGLNDTRRYPSLPRQSRTQNGPTSLSDVTDVAVEPSPTSSIRIPAGVGLGGRTMTGQRVARDGIVDNSAGAKEHQIVDGATGGRPNSRVSLHAGEHLLEVGPSGD